MVGRGGGRAFPDFCRPCAGLRPIFLFLLFLLALGVGQPSLVGRDLVGRQLAADVGPPCFGDTAAPASEGPRRDVACTKDVPPRFITAPAIAGEAMQFAVRRDELGRRKSSLSDGGPELI
jgi:hypothetical protein